MMLRNRTIVYGLFGAGAAALGGLWFLTVCACAPGAEVYPEVNASITVYHDPDCGCCGMWVEHLRENGFEVAVHGVPNVAEYKQQLGVPGALQSCHTAVVDGYAIEGHVPAAEIQRLLRERPEAKGLAVPGMPLGSPGMEVGPNRERYNVMLFDADGRASVYQEYPAVYAQ